MLFTYPLMCVIQEISGRIGRTTGVGIAGNLRKHYPSWLLQTIVGALFIANTINIGADLGAMADVLTLLVGAPYLVFVLAFGIFCATLQIIMQYARYVAVLKWLTVALFAYFGTVMVVKIPWGEAAAGSFCPRFPETSNSGPPSLPSSARRSVPTCSSGKPRRRRRTPRRTRNASRSSARQGRAPTPSSASGSTPMWAWFSNLVALAIMVTTAAPLHAAGIRDVESSAQAAEALRPVAGEAAFIIFALGVIGTGLLAVPVLAGSAAYAVGEARKWPVGLARASRCRPRHSTRRSRWRSRSASA